jgi:hypothetical protein
MREPKSVQSGTSATRGISAFTSLLNYLSEFVFFFIRKIERLQLLRRLINVLTEFTEAQKLRFDIFLLGEQTSPFLHRTISSRCLLISASVGMFG